MACPTERDVPNELQAALVRWANESSCECIDIEDDSHFVFLWGVCLCTALVVCFVVTLPFCPRCSCGKRNSNSDQHASSRKREQEARTDDEDLQVPDLVKALEHLKKTSPTKDGKWRPLWGTKLSDMAEIGGTGMQLYFRLLRNLGIVFCYMAALTCASLAFNVLSNFAPDNGNALTKTTAGNLGASMSGTDIEPHERYLILKNLEGGCQGTAVWKMTQMLGWLDFLGIVVFLLAIGIFRFYSLPKITKQSVQWQVTPKRFAVEIDKLPRTFDGYSDFTDLTETITKYEQELSELIVRRVEAIRDQEKRRAGASSAGSSGSYDSPVKVEELVLVRDFRGKLRRIKQNAVQKKQAEIARFVQDTAKTNRLDKEVRDIDDKIAKDVGDERKLSVLRAYAILSTAQDARRLQVDYRFTTYSFLRLISQCLGNCGVFEGCCPQRRRMFHGRAIRIRPAPEPSDIIWENQDVPYLNRKLRQVVVALIFLFILFVSFSLVYAANYGAKSAAKSNSLLLGDSTCDPDSSRIDVDVGSEAYMCYVQNATSWTIDWVVDHATHEEKTCYCGAIGYATIAKDPMLFKGVCKEWLIAVGSGIAIGVIATGIVVGINLICKRFLNFLAEMEKPASFSALNASKMFKIFALQTLNTGFVVFCVNFAPPEWVPLGNIIFLGEFRDAVRGWYVVVGTAIMSNMLANAVTPAFDNISMIILNKITRRCCAYRKKHHTQLKELYTNPEFDVAARFAQLLNTIYVTLAYSAGMPILYCFAAIYMLFTFWADKVTLLWGSKRPPALDAQIPKLASQLMLYAVPCHCIFAIWMYGQPCTFPSKPLGGALKTLAERGQATASQGSIAASDSISERVQKESTWMLFTMAVLLLSLWVLWTVLWILGGTLGEFLKCFCIVCCRKAAKVSAAYSDKPDVWTSVKHEIETNCPPASYAWQRHPDFEEYAKLMDAGMGGTARSGFGATGGFKGAGNSGAGKEPSGAVGKKPRNPKDSPGSSREGELLATSVVPVALS